ncbi:MAG: CHAP domain-containing protein [Eubacteriales bacterium]
MTPVEKLIDTAQSQIGYLEKATNSQLDDFTANAGRANFTKYARDMHQLGVYNGNKNGYPWCDVFVDWCFVQTFGLELAMQLTCQSLGGLGAGCTYSANYFKSKNQFFTANPKPGDQIFFTNDNGKTSYHTGLVYQVDGSCVYTIEGNTSDVDGVVENGGAVVAKSYSLTYYKIYGYGRPDFDLVPVSETPTAEPSDWSQEAREWAVETGLIAGDGKGDMKWLDNVTREQLVTILYRYHNLAKD